MKIDRERHTEREMERDRDTERERWTRWIRDMKIERER